MNRRVGKKLTRTPLRFSDAIERTGTGTDLQKKLPEIRGDGNSVFLLEAFQATLVHRMALVAMLLSSENLTGVVFLAGRGQLLADAFDLLFESHAGSILRWLGSPYSDDVLSVPISRR